MMSENGGSAITNRVHGKEEGGMVKLSLRCTMIAPFAALVQPLNDQRCLWKDKAFIF
jgi:hypothetical protein